MCAGGLLTANAQDNFISRYIATNDSLERAINEDQELVERMRNMPNIEVGKGITFEPKGITFEPQNKLYKMTLRFRMQNMVAFHLDKDFSMNEVEARVKRLRLRFDGYIFSPKLLYSIQLGFTPYDAQDLPNGNTNIVRDAIVYYMPNNSWNIGFGQTKIKATRRYCLLYAQQQLEYRFRTDQDQGEPGKGQLLECAAVCRPEHRQLDLQHRSRLRLLRRI